jgi:hypothetical protein
VGQELLGPSYFLIPLVLGPLISLVWYVPSLRYTRGLGWRMHCGAEVTESITNKQHHLSGKAGCKPSTCPNGNPDAQKEHAAKKAERERANSHRQVRRLQGACNVSDDEAVSDEENAQLCLLSPLASPNLLPSNLELSPEVFPKFLGTVCYELSHDLETPIEHACITVAPVLPPFMRPGLARHGETVVHIYKTQCRIMPNYSSEKGPVVDTGAQRGAAKHPSEIVTHTGNSHNKIGVLGDAKILPGIIMGCETIDTNGRPFTLIVPDDSVSDPTLTDSLIPVGRLKEDGFNVSFRIPVEAHLDGVDLTVYPKYGGKIVTPEPDSRTIFMEYEDETWRLPKPTIVLKRVLPTMLADPIKHLQRYLHAHKCKYCDANLGRASYYCKSAK